jgi:hypothetical protein
VSKGAPNSTAELHKLWAGLEDEHHQIAIALEEAVIGGADVTLLRDQQTKLLLDISAVVAAIREAPATTLEDYLALLDVAIEHEIDLVTDIAFYGPADFPMITRLLRALAQQTPGFEFNSLRRWLSAPGQYEQVTGRQHPSVPQCVRPEPSNLSLVEAPRERPKIG